MYRNASWGALGVSVGFEEGLDLARRHGFEAADSPVAEAADRLDAGTLPELAAQYASRGLRPGPWGLPLRWQGSEDDWRADLERLPRLARAAHALGTDRCCTWVPSWSDTRAWDENWRFHLARFRPAAQALADYGCRLGLEFIGTPTLRVGKAHTFIHTCAAMLELCAEIGPNVGLLLDAWHWYTSGGAAADLTGLTNADVVHVHVNDAPADVAVDAQLDGRRCLPCDTGVIDLALFMHHVRRLAYDGPVTVEPFNQELRQLAPEAAAERTAHSLDALLALAP